MTRKTLIILVFVVLLATVAVLPLVYGQTDDCEQTVGAGTHSGTWGPGCDSANRSGNYARFYTFTTSTSSEVTIILESTAADTYLNLLSGSGTRGSVIASNDDAESGNTNSQIAETLAAGTYTVEATTFDAGETGDFTLTISGAGVVEPGTGGTAPGGPATASAVLVSSETEVCAITSKGTASCRTVNTGGRTTPPKGVHFVALARGHGHVCGLTDAYEIFCWGRQASEGSTGTWTKQPITSNSYSLGILNSDETGSIAGPWYQALECSAGGNPSVYLYSAIGLNGIGETNLETVTVPTTVDGNSAPSSWFYFTPYLVVHQF